MLLFGYNLLVTFMFVLWNAAGFTVRGGTIAATDSYCRHGNCGNCPVLQKHTGRAFVYLLEAGVFLLVMCEILSGNQMVFWEPLS